MAKKDNKKQQKADAEKYEPEVKGDKKAKPPLAGENSKEFQKDWDKLASGAKHNMGELKKAMLLIMARDGMPESYQDHELKGTRAGIRDCHVGGDFILLYRIDMLSPDWGIATFLRAGTHSELFGNKK